MKLDDIKDPKDIKELSIEELKNLNQEIRDFLISSISKTGGHLGSSLGAVDFICALHYVFDSPKDKLIFDVGHQAYAHKVLTGRAKDFKTLRQYKGMSGFLKKEESVHDVWESGHASNSISAAIGYAMQRDLDNQDNHVVAIIGDGSMNGMSLEALNHLIELDKRIIILINDNEMSISKNIGFIDKMFKNLEVNRSYDSTKKIIKDRINSIDNSQKVSKLISNIKNRVKTELNQTKGFFDLLGFKYLGPVDGHNIKDLIAVLEEAKKITGPTVLHVKTTKGKGYLPAEENSWHGINKFDIKTGQVKKEETISNSKVISNELLNIMDKNDDVIVITPAMIFGSDLENIQKKYPHKITDVGIAEEHAASLAAGLALAGKKPFLSIYSTFLQRAYDQTFQDIARQKCNVVVGIDRAGLVGADGETHQGIYDISFLLHMPNVCIMQGKDAAEMRGLLNLSFQMNGPTFLRYSRNGKYKDEELKKPIPKIEQNKWEIVKNGNSLNIITYGEDVLTVYNEFKENLDVGVINARFIKPLDTDVLNKISQKPIIVLEENCRIGGLGTFILDYYNKHKIKHNITILAIEDHFVEHGNIIDLKRQEHIDIENVKKEVGAIINGKY